MYYVCLTLRKNNLVSNVILLPEPSLGPVVNIFVIFSNANILKKIRE